MYLWLWFKCIRFKLINSIRNVWLLIRMIINYFIIQYNILIWFIYDLWSFIKHYSINHQLIMLFGEFGVFYVTVVDLRGLRIRVFPQFLRAFALDFSTILLWKAGYLFLILLIVIFRDFLFSWWTELVNYLYICFEEAEIWIWVFARAEFLKFWILVLPHFLGDIRFNQSGELFAVVPKRVSSIDFVGDGSEPWF